MPYKVSVQRQTVTGEIITVDTELNSLAEWHSRIPQACDLLDARMVKLNKRVLDANKELGHLTEKEHGVLTNVMFGLFGISLPPRSQPGEVPADAAAQDAL